MWLSTRAFGDDWIIISLLTKQTGYVRIIVANDTTYRTQTPALLWIVASNCYQKLFQLRILPSKVGMLILDNRTLGLALASSVVR